MMTATPTLDHLDAQQLRELATRLMAEMRVKQVLIDKLTHEMATLKRLKFAAASEAYPASGCNSCSRPSRPISKPCRPKSRSSRRRRLSKEIGRASCRERV